LATAFGALAAAFTVVAILIALGTIFVGIQWGKTIAREAKDEAAKAARDEVGRLAEPIIDRWLTTEGVAALRQAAQMTQPAGADDAANEIAKNVDT
jgi:hypothetical protein